MPRGVTVSLSPLPDQSGHRRWYHSPCYIQIRRWHARIANGRTRTTLSAPRIRKIAAVELTVEAALTGSRALFVEALLADGCVSDPAVAGRLADDLLAAHRAHLPQFS